MPFNLRDLGNNIKKIRESRESQAKPGKPMHQYELAQVSNIPASILCNIEKGKYKNPTWAVLSKIAAGLRCEISDFFLNADKKVSPSHIAMNEMIETIIRERLEDILREKSTDKKIIKK